MFLQALLARVFFLGGKIFALAWDCKKIISKH
jgi:hypothetical protein